MAADDLRYVIGKIVDGAGRLRWIRTTIDGRKVGDFRSRNLVEDFLLLEYVRIVYAIRAALIMSGDHGDADVIGARAEKKLVYHCWTDRPDIVDGSSLVGTIQLGGSAIGSTAIRVAV